MFDATGNVLGWDRRTFVRNTSWGTMAAVSLGLESLTNAACAQDKIEIPEPESVSFETKDGVVIRATYYGGTNKEETVPIIMVHDFGGQRGDFHRLALGLQKARGHAILVPDLRGHGESTRRRGPDGNDMDLSPDKLKPSDYAAMIAGDLEECKKFLMKKHNGKELNIEKLVVVGAGPMGTVVALNWVHQDWSWKQTPFLKQGQDVKALVLLSPANTFKSLKTAQVFSHPYIAAKLSVMLVGSKTESDIKQIYNKFKAKHAPTPETVEEQVKHQDLFYFLEDTEVRGAKLLAPELQVNKNILTFIDYRIVNKAEDYPWKSRDRNANG
ncbi:MAG: alpha/beta fold hydrolase [Pirellulales bacterium]